MTDYDNYQTYNSGEDWEYNTEMQRLFNDRVVKGTKAERPTAGDAPADALYEATDENIIYRNDATNGWVEVSGNGTESQPLSEKNVETLKISDTGQDPSQNGEIRRNGSQLKAYTEGSVSAFGVPAGVITMWSGSVSNVPEGWTLCDGNNGAPDLRNRFVVGAGDSYSVDQTGGLEKVQLVESQMPSHSHSGGKLETGKHIHDGGTLSTASHEHDSGNLGTDRHRHGNGDLTADDHEHGVLIFDQERGVVSGSDFDAWYDNTLTTSLSEKANVSGRTSYSSPGVSGTTGPTSANVSGDTGDTVADVSGNTGDTGSDNSHENRPPYYALAYIMKQ